MILLSWLTQQQQQQQQPQPQSQTGMLLLRPIEQPGGNSEQEVPRRSATKRSGTLTLTLSSNSQKRRKITKQGPTDKLTNPHELPPDLVSFFIYFYFSD